jgi:hypothetical protein
MAAGLSRSDRIQAAGRLDELAAELDKIAGWLDLHGDDCDKASVLLECSTRDLRAACWIIKSADHELPPDWLAPQGRFRPL